MVASMHRRCLWAPAPSGERGGAAGQHALPSQNRRPCQPKWGPKKASKQTQNSKRTTRSNTTRHDGDTIVLDCGVVDVVSDDDDDDDDEADDDDDDEMWGW